MRQALHTLITLNVGRYHSSNKKLLVQWRRHAHTMVLPQTAFRGNRATSSGSITTTVSCRTSAAPPLNTRTQQSALLYLSVRCVRGNTALHTSMPGAIPHKRKEQHGSRAMQSPDTYVHGRLCCTRVRVGEGESCFTRATAIFKLTYLI